ncbi:MAG: hypothetical protein BMS9Abin36_1123 [Gammaproteobacteria bacterium]|nr:MAG: hypothetical protein BMS9Abin36_1123 [Gammaproteobacteria bacterium]
MADIRRKGKIPVGPNQYVDAELMETESSEEKWSVFLLDDGTTLKLKPAVLEIWRVIDEYDANGDPKYMVKSQNMMTVYAPDNLKKKAK